MPKLVHAIFVKNEEHCIERMLDAVLPYVEQSYIMLDDTTTDRTKEIILDLGCIVKEFTFENFSKTKNTLLKWMNDKTDWVIGIAPDETIDPGFGKMLHTLLPKLHPSNVDNVRFPRRHWDDLEMTDEYTKENWYPDWQARLLRVDFPRIHLVRYVHEIVVGARRQLQIKDFDIHHFNRYWKSKVDYDWEAMDVLYDALKIKEKEEGGKNIWPE